VQQAAASGRRLLGALLVVLVVLAGLIVAGTPHVLRDVDVQHEPVAGAVAGERVAAPADEETARTGRVPVSWPGAGGHPVAPPDPPRVAGDVTTARGVIDDAARARASSIGSRLGRAPPGALG
jgi:hypothetical protein